MRNYIKIARILRSIPYSIYFNFHYLPFAQACKLPILLYKPKLLKMDGEVKIETEKVHFGMIQLGNLYVPLFPYIGIVWENHGGKVIFKGKCRVGNASAISIGKTGNIIFGNNFIASSGLKLVSYHHIEFAENVRLAWECIVMDTSLHKLKDLDGNQLGKGYGSILIGKNNWIPTRCIVLNGTRTPDYCIFGAGSILKKDYSRNPTHILMAGNPLTVKRTGVWRDADDDSIEYDR
jgi:acetyltransferase-like isoleucine patch superfamily enzyme